MAGDIPAPPFVCSRKLGWAPGDRLVYGGSGPGGVQIICGLRALFAQYTMTGLTPMSRSCGWCLRRNCFKPRRAPGNLGGSAFKPRDRPRGSHRGGRTDATFRTHRPCLALPCLAATCCN